MTLGTFDFLGHDGVVHINPAEHMVSGRCPHFNGGIRGSEAFDDVDSQQIAQWYAHEAPGGRALCFDHCNLPCSARDQLLSVLKGID